MMDILLKLMGGALGVVVPALFAYTMGQGISRAPLAVERKGALRKAVFGSVGAWTAIAWAAALTGLTDAHPGDLLPRVFAFLAAPVAAGAMALTSKDFRTVVEHTPLPALVGAQAFRFAGAAFLLVTYLGILPSAFATGGVGDLLTATLAVVAALQLSRGAAGGRTAFWAFTAAGLADLLNVAFLMAAYDPGHYAGIPSSAPLASFGLVMIPAIAAPLALLLHAYAAFRVLATRSAAPRAVSAAAR